MKKTSIATFSRATATKSRVKGTILVENACLLQDLNSSKRIMVTFVANKEKYVAEQKTHTK